jgi:hypothetical protein
MPDACDAPSLEALEKCPIINTDYISSWFVDQEFWSFVCHFLDLKIYRRFLAVSYLLSTCNNPLLCFRSATWWPPMLWTSYM